jgi:hypothetical protein
MGFTPDGYGFIFTPTGWTRTEMGSGMGFIFHPWVHPIPGKNLKVTRKNPEAKVSRRVKLLWNPKKNPKLKKPPKNLKRKCPFTKPDGHPKPDRFGFGCQISSMGVGSGVKINPTTFFHESSFWSTQPECDPLPSLVLFVGVVTNSSLILIWNMQDTFLKKDIILLKKYVQILLKWYWFGGIRALALLNTVLDQGLKYRYRVKNRSPSVWPVTVKAGKIGQKPVWIQILNSRSQKPVYRSVLPVYRSVWPVNRFWNW